MIWLTAWLKTGLLAVIFERIVALFYIPIRHLSSVWIPETLKIAQ